VLFFAATSTLSFSPKQTRYGFDFDLLMAEMRYQNFFSPLQNGQVISTFKSNRLANES
jgi:hypothetical protein